MKKERVLLFVAFILSIAFKSLSQNEVDVFKWIDSNPDVVLINSKNLNEFSDEDLALLKNKFIIFNDKLKADDIVLYEKNKKSFETKIEVPANIINKSDADADKIFITKWTLEHKEIKLIKKSEYNEKNHDLYLADKCLLLNGEFITKQDILNYPY